MGEIVKISNFQNVTGRVYFVQFINTSIIKHAEHDIFRNICAYVHMNSITISEIKSSLIEGHREGYLREFRGRELRTEML